MRRKTSEFQQLGRNGFQVRTTVNKTKNGWYV